jgi:hypothetical protein
MYQFNDYDGTMDSNMYNMFLEILGTYRDNKLSVGAFTYLTMACYSANLPMLLNYSIAIKLGEI